MNYKNKAKGNGVAKAIAIVLALLIFFVGGGVLGWFASAGQWFGAKDPQKEDGGLIVTESEAHGVSITARKVSLAEYEEYGIAPQSDSAYTVTATVKNEAGESPEYIQEVTYSMAWASENSATLNDYVTMTQEGATATVTCKQAFSVRIDLICTSVLDSSVSATAKLDYEKRFQGVNVSFRGVTATVTEGQSVNIDMPAFPSSSSWDNSVWDTTTTMQYAASEAYGMGTVAGGYNISGVSVAASAAFKSAVDAYDYKSYLPFTGTVGGQGRTTSSLAGHFETICGSGNSFRNYTLARWAVYCGLHDTTNQFEVTVNYTYKGENKAIHYKLNFVNVQQPSVSGITFDQSNIIF